MRASSVCTKPELFTQVSKASFVFVPGSVKICFSIHPPLEHLQNKQATLKKKMFHWFDVKSGSHNSNLLYRPAAPVSLHVTVDSHCSSVFSLWVDVHFP